MNLSVAKSVWRQSKAFILRQLVVLLRCSVLVRWFAECAGTTSPYKYILVLNYLLGNKRIYSFVNFFLRRQTDVGYICHI